MSKTWDYAELSKLASENGGPENFINILIDFGKKQTAPLIVGGVIGGVIAGVGITIGAQKVVAYFKEKQKESEKEVELAKQELIRGIKEYDKSQQKNNNDKKRKNL